ncbi:MAG: TRAP transporter large permease subunit, partial [Gammaproteobacteria bacterium]|nr:TRAP transporter large permease subunit [Gammaproteobacteria bacterium]
TMGLLSLPTMLRRNYDPGVAAGTICAAGTLGQIIPPSIILVLLGDVLASAYQQAQLAQGVFSPESLTVGDLFAGAIIPGLILVGLFVLYLLWLAIFHGDRVPAVIDVAERNYSKRDIFVKLLRGLVAPLALICAVLGSILGGIATPTEAASVGAMGAMLLAAVERQLSVSTLADVVRRTTLMTSMVFMILFGAALFSLVFRGFGGDELVKKLLTNLPGGAFGAILVVMLIMFVLGFVLDFIEIIFVVVPIVGPVLLAMDINPIWLGVMMAVNLQTSFLTPPFGFALFYLRGVAPPELTTGQIYRGVIPFIVLQLIGLCIIAAWPGLVTWLPKVMSAG